MSQSLKNRHPEVLWPRIVALRNILVHEYLPKLEEQVQRIHWEIAPDSRCGA